LADLHARPGDGVKVVSIRTYLRNTVASSCRFIENSSGVDAGEAEASVLVEQVAGRVDVVASISDSILPRFTAIINQLTVERRITGAVGCQNIVVEAGEAGARTRIIIIAVGVNRQAPIE
jgi:hypothetical protein